MVFNSLSFLIFFPIAVLGYYLLPQRFKNLWLLVLSYYFYMCWNAVYALLMFFSTLSTWLCAHWMGKMQAEAGRKLALGVNIGVNLGILFLFKYYDMFMQLVVDGLALAGIRYTAPVLSLLLPVGISFYTFQALGYSIDVYRGTVKHEKSFLDYMLFVSFFPQLVAGPIERSANLLPQFHKPHPFVYDNLAMGLRIMLWGFFKKVVIADNIALAVDRMYTYIEVFPGPVLLAGVILFGVQIYCDFGGYSDIAMGAAKALGFDLMENFRRPYFSRSIREFWRRWHISLNTWFTDYVYIPLGGSRCSRARHLFNLLFVFFLSGLWHGASWTYVCWGLYHGLWLCLETVTLPRVEALQNRLNGTAAGRLLAVCRVAGTFLAANLGWIFFRSDYFTQVSYLFTHLHRGWGIFADPLGAAAAFASLADSTRISLIILVSVLVLFAAELLEEVRHKRVYAMAQQLSLPVQWCVYYLLLFGIALFGAFGQSSFIYFQF